MLGTSSPILRRILAVNVLALAILVAGILYLGEYRRGLIEQELDGLEVQAELLAAALGESAAEDASPNLQRLRPAMAVQMVRRLVETTGGRARLFSPDGVLIADSRFMSGPGTVQSEELPPPDGAAEEPRGPLVFLLDAYERMVRLLPGGGDMPPYREMARQSALDYPEVVQAVRGESGRALYSTPRGQMVLVSAVPVQRYKQVLGAVMLSRTSDDIEEALRQIRIDILKIFTVSLLVTVALSLYLAGTIARPIRRLAAAAEKVRHGHHRQHRIPDFADRGDEIGELALALGDMTEALWTRMDAIESFAADVAHEIKNPLTSLKSAVETAARVDDPAQQQKLMDIILDDVGRLDRLIGDISDASRLDAELSRAETAPVDIGRMLGELIAARRETSGRDIAFTAEPGRQGLIVTGIESRLGQVFANLLANAMSFGPEGGRIAVTAAREDGAVSVVFEDDGPGIPEGKLEAIFERFYTERPEGEKFGTHSGLGLSISRQIVEAHEGTIRAQNRVDASGAVIGARFIVRFPDG